MAAPSAPFLQSSSVHPDTHPAQPAVPTHPRPPNSETNREAVIHELVCGALKFLLSPDNINNYTYKALMGAKYTGGAPNAFLVTHNTEARRQYKLKLSSYRPTDINERRGEHLVKSIFNCDNPSVILLQHHCVAKTYGVPSHEVQIFPYRSGKDLFALLENNTPFSKTDIVRCMIEVGEAVSCIHANNAAHRDIKPENILIFKGLDGLWHAACFDFETARQQAKGEPIDLSPRGSVATWPPECVRKWLEAVKTCLKEKEIDHLKQMTPQSGQNAPSIPIQKETIEDAQKQDAFAFGFLLYQFLAGGQLPFFPKTLNRDEWLACSDPMIAVHYAFGECELSPGIANIPLFGDMLVSLLARDPNQRMSVTQATEELQKILADLPPENPDVAAAPHVQPPPPPMPNVATPHARQRPPSSV